MSDGPGECRWGESRLTYMIDIALTTDFTIAMR
jgi:hypothetical protein